MTQSPSNKLTIGILAHVDAGKTTLAEAMLYLTGSIRKFGRVDHRNTFLDTNGLERARGITIFSKQASIIIDDKDITLLDTPGHVDFSAEMERTLQVLDYAILVINGADGVQGHSQTLWRLLRRYNIPVFLFINKMDQDGTNKDGLLENLKMRLDDHCLDFDVNQDKENFRENLAMCDEQLLEQYLDTGKIMSADIIRLISRRKVFPCYFGSALKMQGIDELLNGISRFTACPSYPDTFGAKVYKVARDAQGSRLTHMKITGGSLKVKALLSCKTNPDTVDVWEEKADQIRIYSGDGYQTVSEAPAGTVCAVTGLTRTYSGEGLGIEAASDVPLLEPVLTYQIKLPANSDVHGMILKLRQLEEEDPLLNIIWDERHGEIHAQVMGEVQIEILKSLIQERFGAEVEFSSGSIIYKETISEPVEGIGHFEPLRHYAEVHLLLEPGAPGSGLEFGVRCSEDVLDRNWQRLVLTHLEEKKHRGVLTGSEITDMKITLLTGRAHLKHTEGGDFRQATYRAVRQGLKKAKSVLLEPVYEFSLEIPTEMVGRAMSDIQKMHGSFLLPRIEGDVSVIEGTAPAVTMRGYQMEVVAYSRGMGRLSCDLKGYEPCHNADEIMAEKCYDSEQDLDNPTGSVFCSHGAGFTVSWDQVEDYMHVDSGLQLWTAEKKTNEPVDNAAEPANASAGWIDEKELEAIFVRTYGPIKRRQETVARKVYQAPAAEKFRKPQKQEKRDEYLLVDGYNIIFAWEELNQLAQLNIESARTKLMDILCNYQGFKKNTLILVFDAYKVKGNKGEVQQYHNIHVVYTKEAETADQYIEKVVHQIGRKYDVIVATSDALEQVIIMGQGARRLSAQGLKEEIRNTEKEIRNTEKEIRREYLEKLKLPRRSGNYLFDSLPDELAKLMEDVRLGKKELDGDELF